MSLPQSVIIFGATSDIAYETAKEFARRKCSLYLCARSEDELKRISSDLLIRGAKSVFYKVFDATDSKSISIAWENALEVLPDLDGLLIAHGVLPVQSQAESNESELRKTIEINFTSATVILEQAAAFFEKKRKGTIVVISSVAGDRGRQSNYIYGSTKAALSVYLQGLRNRMFAKGVQVITIKPGFVETKMTADLKKNALFAKPKSIAEGIIAAIEKDKDEVYLPFFWKWIMLSIKLIPEKVFKKLSL